MWIQQNHTETAVLLYIMCPEWIPKRCLKAFSMDDDIHLRAQDHGGAYVHDHEHL